MAGYIEWEKGLASKPEVVRMAARLKKDRHEIAGRLMVFWEWTDENVPEENVDPETGSTEVVLSPNRGDNETFVDSVVGLDGFCAAMSDAGWLVHRSSSILLPNFSRHNGLTAKTRTRNAKNQANRRDRLAKANGKMSPNGGDKVMTTQPNRTQPNNWDWALRNLALEEFKRPSVLLVRYARLVERKCLTGCEANMHNFFGFAARAIKLGENKDPRRLFVSLLKEWDLSKITTGYADEASRMLKESMYT